MLVLNLPAFESKKYAAYDHFDGNSLYGEIPTKKGPITMLGFALPYNNGHLQNFCSDRKRDLGPYKRSSTWSLWNKFYNINI